MHYYYYRCIKDIIVIVYEYREISRSLNGDVHTLIGNNRNALRQ